METAFDAIRFVFLMTLAIAGNITGFYIKHILGKNGYVTYWYRGHFKDIANLFDLIGKINDETTRKNYKLLVRSHIGVLVVFVLFAVTFIFEDVQRYPCKWYYEFLAKEVDGQVTNKFIDKPNHATPTLTIETNSETINDSDFTTRNGGLYDSIKIGDRIRKITGDSVTYIDRQGRTIEFKINKKQYCEN
jgi:hypothetical protein